MLNSLFGPLFDEQVKNTMSSTSHITLIIDNFQVGQRLKNQRGGHSSNFIFMSGTNRIAEKPRVYDNPKYKTKKPKTELQYNLQLGRDLSFARRNARLRGITFEAVRRTLDVYCHWSYGC
jgi:hypothetical protein